MNLNHEKYIKLAKTHTKEEIAQVMNLKIDTIRKYQRETGVKYIPTHYDNKSLSEWKNQFNSHFKNQLEVENLIRTRTGHVIGDITCLKCGYAWSGNIMHKLKMNSICPQCTKGNRGNKYSFEQVQKMLNAEHSEHWELVSYNDYSQKNNCIKCLLCGVEHIVNLSDFLNSTSKRCTHCESGSYGEFVIAACLSYNNIEYKREQIVVINGHKYRFDFILNNRVIEYNGEQHFKPGLYYSENINIGMQRKEQWCKAHKYQFIEIPYSRTLNDIFQSLSEKLNCALKLPTPDYIAKFTPELKDVLEYMKSHSARQTCKDLNITRYKLQNYIYLAGYSSISQWQKENLK